MSEKPPLLVVEALSKTYGGLEAVSDVSFSVGSQEILALVGPNGAGKSTIFDLVAGAQPADKGKIVFDKREIAGRKPHYISRAGIARTFQKLRPFDDMTVVANVIVGALPRCSNVAEARADALVLLEKVGIAAKANAFAGTLSTGQRKRLELARALSTRPRLLLLDEITGGVDVASVPGLLQLVSGLRDGGLTILLIEHNMKVVKAVADRMLVLHLGKLIARGDPSVVLEDPAVEEAYLGRPHAGS